MDADKAAEKQRNAQVLEDLKLKGDNGRKQSEFNGPRLSMRVFAKTVLAAIARDYQTHGDEIIQNTQGAAPGNNRQKPVIFIKRGAE